MASKYDEPVPGLFQCWGYGDSEVPKDSENKAKTIRFWTFSQPYMRAFHLNYVAFFLTFVSTFAPAVSAKSAYCFALPSRVVPPNHMTITWLLASDIRPAVAPVSPSGYHNT